jgi:hypothetical protein
MPAMNGQKDESRIEIASIVYIILLGFAIRLVPPLLSEFPLNDGGLFGAMIGDIKNNGFVLPAATTYNSAGIPFVYPPIALYFTALASSLTGIAISDLLRILPPVFSGLAIHAFYVLAREFTRTKLQTVLSVLAFAFAPRVFEWHMTGGGITRAPGFIFAILTMTYALRLYKNPNRKNLLAASIFGALTLLTHPEAAVHTAISAGFFYLWTSRSIKGLLNSTAAALGVLVLSSPWWLSAIIRHGFAPFQAAFSAVGADSPNLIVRIFAGFLFVFTDEPYLSLIAVFAIVGLFVSIASRDFFIIIWMFLLYFLEPRGGALYMMIPLALLAGIGLESATSIIFFGKNTPSVAEIPLRDAFKHNTARWFIAFLFVYMLMSAFATGERLRQNYSLKHTDIKAMEWIHANVSTGVSFAVITGETSPFRDPWSEWFPVIAGHKSLATIFGYEWLNDGQFAERIQRYESLQACARDEFDCLLTWEINNSLDITHVYLQRDESSLPLQLSLAGAADFQLIYQTDSATIYEQR